MKMIKSTLKLATVCICLFVAVVLVIEIKTSLYFQQIRRIPEELNSPNLIQEISKITLDLSSSVLVGKIPEQFFPATFLPRTLKNKSAKVKNQSNVNQSTAATISDDEVIQENIRQKSKFYKPVLLFNAQCQTIKCISSKVVRWKMVTFVKSRAENTFRRQMIRRTWGSISYVNGGQFSTLFVIGISSNRTTQAIIEEEYERNKDMMFIDAPDDYLNVPLKTLAGMQWASENLKDNNFYSSCDDDMMVNLGEMQENIDRYTAVTTEMHWPEFPIICGYEYWNDTVVHPLRDENDKNFVSEKKYRWTDWPQFCLGGMYTTSVRVIRLLFDISRTLPLLNTDDVWITGIMRNILGMPSSMLIKAVPAIANHNLLFGLHSKKKLTAMLMNDWHKNFTTFETKTICKC